MNFISKNFKKTFVIAGNHEYYNKKKMIYETDAFLETYFEQFDNMRFFFFLYEIYDNFCFIGTTLWSKITNPNYKINDEYQIPNFDHIQYNKLNEECVDFLKNTLEDSCLKNCIVITHHMPSQSRVDIKYKTPTMLPYNQWYYCDLDELIDTHKEKIKCWFYGHTHIPSDGIINDIPFLCNPIGYPNENKILDFEKTFTIAD